MSTLEQKQAFLLYLKANNYSQKTVRSYDRDLAYFEAFLSLNLIEFKNLKKHNIDEYKAALASEDHHDFLELVNEFWDSSGSKEKTKKEKKQKLLQDIKRKNQKQGMNSPLESETPLENDYNSISSQDRATAVFGLQNGATSTKLSTSSINRMLSSLRSYLKFLEDRDAYPPLAASNIRLMKKEKIISQVADYAELVRLIEYPEVSEKEEDIRLRNRAILELLFSTGMRISELVSLNRDQLSSGKLDKDNPIQTDRILIFGKGKKQRYVYLTPRAKEHLYNYLEKRGDDFPALFVQRFNKKKSLDKTKDYRLTVSMIQKKIAQYRRELGIAIPTSAHSLRHGFATYLIENGANTAAVQVLLGHESLATTTRYVHASDKFAQETHKQFHPSNDKK